MIRSDLQMAKTAFSFLRPWHDQLHFKATAVSIHPARLLIRKQLEKRLIICFEIILLWKPKCPVPGLLRLFYNGIQIASLVIRHARRALRQRIFIDLLDLRRRPASVSKGRLAVLASADRLPDAPCVLLSVSDQILAVGAVVFYKFLLSRLLDQVQRYHTVSSVQLLRNQPRVDDAEIMTDCTALRRVEIHNLLRFCQLVTACFEHTLHHRNP